MGKKLDLLGRRLGFVGDLAYGLVDLVAFRITRKLSANPLPPETLDDIAEEINSGKLFVPVFAADLCRQSSYALSENGKLYLDGGRALSTYLIANSGAELLYALMEDRKSCVEVSQKMAKRIAKAAEREGLDVPPYVQYRATRSDGKIAKYGQSAAKYAAMALSWFVISAGLVSHFIEYDNIRRFTNSCKPTVSPDQKNALCYKWNKTEQAASVWKRTPFALSQRIPFYVPPFDYEKIQNIPYSDVPKHPEAVEALTAYAGKAGCPTASSQKLRQTFEGISRLPSTPEVKRAATVRVVEQIVQIPKNACSML